MNTKKKGQRTLYKIMKQLRDAGWLVSIVERPTRFNRNKDMFNLFDLVAVKGPYIKFIQAKTNQWGSMKHIKEFTANHGSEFLSCEVWQWKDYDGMYSRILNDEVELKYQIER